MTLRTRARPWLARLLVLAVLAASGLVAGVSAASADVYPCRRAGGEYRSQCAKVTDAAGALPLQLGAGYGNTRPGTAYHNGDELALACWTTGPSDEYGNGDPYWLEVFDPNDTSVLGFVNDYNLTTGQPADWTKHLSHCTDPVSQAGKPYQCDRQGGEYRAWCANVTYVAEDMWLPLDKKADYADGEVGGTQYHNGDPLALACWTTGPADFGGHGDRYWFSVFNPADNAIEGYVNDYQLTTGSPADWKKVVPSCGGDQPPGQNPPPPPTSYPHSVNVLQWNIAGLAKNRGFPLPDEPLANAVKVLHADLVSMNETCASQAENVAGDVTEKTGKLMYVAFIPTSWNPLCRITAPSRYGDEAGNAILSFKPLSDETHTYFANGSDRIVSYQQERGIVCATVAYADPIRMCSAHLAAPEKGNPLPSHQAQAFAEAIHSQLAKRPTVIAGDFNAEPTELKDEAPAYDPASHDRMFYEASHLSTSFWTYQNYDKPNSRGTRLDYIFGNTGKFKNPGAHDAYPVSAETCDPWWSGARPCSDHRMYFGTLHYHK